MNDDGEGLKPRLERQRCWTRIGEVEGAGERLRMLVMLQRWDFEDTTEEKEKGEEETEMR